MIEKNFDLQLEEKQQEKQPNEEVKTNENPRNLERKQKKELLKQEKIKRILYLKHFENLFERSETLFDHIRKFYGITNEFPTQYLYSVNVHDNIFQPKRFVLINEGLKTFISNASNKELQILACGVTVFKRIKEEKILIKVRFIIQTNLIFVM